LTSALYATSESSFIQGLQRDLKAEIEREMELTLKVAVMSAAGMTRVQITGALDVQDMEVKMAMLRLKKVAHGWD